MTNMEMISNLKKCKEKNYNDFDLENKNIIEIISECLQFNKESRPNLEEIEKIILENIAYFGRSISTFVENES